MPPAQDVQRRDVDHERASGLEDPGHFRHRPPRIVFGERVQHVERGDEVERRVVEREGGDAGAGQPGEPGPARAAEAGPIQVDAVSAGQRRERPQVPARAASRVEHARPVAPGERRVEQGTREPAEPAKPEMPGLGVRRGFEQSVQCVRPASFDSRLRRGHAALRDRLGRGPRVLRGDDGPADNQVAGAGGERLRGAQRPRLVVAARRLPGDRTRPARRRQPRGSPASRSRTRGRAARAASGFPAARPPRRPGRRRRSARRARPPGRAPRRPRPRARGRPGRGS